MRLSLFFIAVLIFLGTFFYSGISGNFVYSPENFEFFFEECYLSNLTLQENILIEEFLLFQKKQASCLDEIYFFKKNHDFSLNEENIFEKNVDKLLLYYFDLGHEFNLKFDNFFEAETKYFYYVNAKEPILSLDLSSEKWEIFNFVRENIVYRKDVNFGSDWIQTPSQTFYLGSGDCEDISIFLASLFLKAGIEDVQLCFADTNFDSSFDHLFVGVGEGGWDATYSGEKSISSEIENWQVYCYDINEYLFN
jgi:hypothetical protein